MIPWLGAQHTGWRQPPNGAQHLSGLQYAHAQEGHGASQAEAACGPTPVAGGGWTWVVDGKGGGSSGCLAKWLDHAGDVEVPI